MRESLVGGSGRAFANPPQDVAAPRSQTRGIIDGSSFAADSGRAPLKGIRLMMMLAHSMPGRTPGAADGSKASSTRSALSAEPWQGRQGEHAEHDPRLGGLSGLRAYPFERGKDRRAGAGRHNVWLVGGGPRDRGSRLPLSMSQNGTCTKVNAASGAIAKRHLEQRLVWSVAK
jgi:hypothetical protein